MKEQLDPGTLAKLWPNRAHESNWLKDLCCAFGFHRWHPLEVGELRCTFCRWCTKVVVRDH